MVRIYARLIRWAFARFYRQFAWTYDAVAALVSGGRWRDWALAALPHLHGRVLELGCGTGNIQRALNARPEFPAPIGLDASPQMLALTRRKIARAGLGARLARADARTLPFSPALFDCLVATFPTEYIFDPAALAEARRVLRPDGRLVVVLAAQFADDGPLQRATALAYRITLQRSPRAAAPEAPAPEAPIPQGHPLERELARAGFAMRSFWQPAKRSRVALLVAQAI